MIKLLHYYYVLLMDVLLREPRLIWKYYKPFSFNKKKGNDTYIFMVDHKMPIGGMFDRLKGVISIYALSKCHNKKFKLLFNYPFDLSRYLIQNEYDWKLNDNELTYSYPLSKPVIAYGECINPERLFQKRSGQIHFYYGYNSLDKINKKYNTEFDWGTLYHELFKPTDYLQKYIDYYTNEIGNNYFVVHFRFLNLLGDKTETDINPSLATNDAKKLMEKCEQEIRVLAEQNEGLRMMLSTDSNNFVEYIKDKIPDVYVVPGKIKHIGTAETTTDEENIKMFIDYYLIAGAKCVYSVVGPQMWKSAFPEYAAKIGNAFFERVFI